MFICERIGRTTKYVLCRAVTGDRALDFYGEEGELESGFDLAGEIGDFGGEHGSAGDMGRLT